MNQSSFPFLFSSSSSCHRLVTLISILLLNPLPLLYGAPTPKTNDDLTVQRHKRQIIYNSDDDGDDATAQITSNLNDYLVAPVPDFVFEGLIGCRFDPDVCNQDEECFDDDVFGQCWDGEGSTAPAFALKTGVNGMAADKFNALEYTMAFLARYHLDWKDYMTQCILSHILSDVHQLSEDVLEIFYQDCLNKDRQLDELAAEQREDSERRQVELLEQSRIFYNNDPYMPLTKSEYAVVASNDYDDAPISVEDDLDDKPTVVSPFVLAIVQALVEKAKSERVNGLSYFDSNSGEEFDLGERPSKLIAEESSMNEPNKLSVSTNEGYPGLIETLQINNNKQLLPLITEDAMTPKIPSKNNKNITGDDSARYFAVETARGYIVINRDFKDQIEGARLLSLLAQTNSWPAVIFTELNADQRTLTFRVLDNAYQINASNVASAALNNQKIIEKELGMQITDSGIGNPRQGVKLSVERQNGSYLAVVTLVTCAFVLFIMGAFTLLYFFKRNDRIRNKLAEITHIKGLSTNYYQDLCRQRMQVQPTGNKAAEIHKTQQAAPSSSAPKTTSAGSHVKHSSEGSSTRSSTSSWSEEPVTPVNMDIMTGHLILSYMEDHLRNRHRLEAEWQALCTDETNEERASCSIATSETNANKNRYSDCVPYDHARIRLGNNGDDDYINASTISDSDPKCKYIATQGPLPNTTNAFWQMVWEQGSCVIVALTRPIENGMTMCHHYWPVEGSARFNDFEVNLVSEHIWSDDYLVRSFYLKNVQTMETRTVTQFHFLTWGELNNPPSARALLDFRRKVNKCFRGRSSPIIVHCNDGVGRTGSFILLDTVLNRICKGAREINIAATLEHIRDQRAKMVKTKDQFEFVFVAVAEEVTHLLKALPQ